MRNNTIGNWNDIRNTISQSSPLLFTVFRNHTTNIHGWLVYNKIRYPLFLVIGIRELDNHNKVKIEVSEFKREVIKMGWVQPDVTLAACPNWENGQETEECNQIKIIYTDIGSTTYCTIEDKDFSITINRYHF